MSDQLFRTGEEYVIRSAIQDSTLSVSGNLEVTLFDDSTDSLTDAATPLDISTEPSGLTRQSVAFDSNEYTLSLSGGNFQAEFEDQVFDVDANTETIDSYVVFVTFNSDIEGASTPEEQLFFSGSLNQSFDLSNITEFVLRGSGIAID